MDTQLKKGLLEICVLAIINKGETYGYRIISDLKVVIDVSETTLYPILRRLEANGYVNVRCMEYNGRLRRYFSISERGKARLSAYLYEMRQVQAIIDYVTQGERI